MKMRRELIEIASIPLERSDWFPWNDLKGDGGTGGIKLASRKPSVYEVRHEDPEER